MPDRAKPDKTKAPAQAPGKKRREPSRRARRAGSGKAMKRVGRTIRAGTATTIKYTRKAVRGFNQFTSQSETNVDVKLSPLKRLIRFFASMTFPTFLVMSLIVVLVSVMAFSNSTITVDRVTLSIVGLPKELEGYTILHLSDLHGREFGSGQNVLLRTINEEKYNLALFTGDMVGASGNAQPFYELLEGLTANRPRFFIAGDSDPQPELAEVRQISGATVGQMVLADWVLGAEQRGATYLAHTTAVPVGAANLWLSPSRLLNTNLSESTRLLADQVKQEKEGVLMGIEQDKNNLPLTSWRYNQTQLTQKASSAMKPGDIHLALSHIPPSGDYMSVAQKLSEEGTTAYLPVVDLTLAGHYCGGVWKIPFYGAPYIPNALYPRHGWFPNQQDVQGARQLGLGILYTTAGLGVTDDVFLPNFRLLNPPQVSLITLTAAITDNLLGE